MAHPRSAKDRRVLEAMLDPLRAMLTSTAVGLIDLAGADAAERAVARGAEPDIPVSSARHLVRPLPPTANPIAYLPEHEGPG
jgi:hypothetical protein